MRALFNGVFQLNRFKVLLRTLALVCLLLGLTGQAQAALSFGAEVNYTVGSNPAEIAAADFNNDGRMDLAVANGDIVNHDISILLGNGDGTFQAAVNYAAGLFPVSIAVGDFNGDGKPDLVVGNLNGSNDISIMLGNGNGTFQPAVNFMYTAAPANPYSIAVDDFDGDGKLDLAVVNRLSAGTVSILRGNGDGSFQVAVNYAVGVDPYSVAVGDFNGDGKNDLAVANYNSNDVSVLLGNGDGTFAVAVAVSYAAGIQHTSVAVGDFNGDGKADLVVANRNSNDVSVLLGNGDGTFATAANYAAGVRPWSVTSGDFNQDGKPDLVMANYGGGITILPGIGDGTFGAAVLYGAIVSQWDVAVADFNGDGKPDLAVTNFTSNNVAILLNTNAAASANANLSNLELSSGTLNPAFSWGVTSYTAAVGNAVSSITVTPTVADATATVTVNGVAVTSGSASGAVALSVCGGCNTINVVVTAQDASTKTYTVVVYRAASSNADLSALSLSSGSLSPTFAAGTTVYSASVANGVSSITVTPTVADNTAIDVRVNGSFVTSGSASGAIALAEGANTITVVVTAADKTQKTYTVTVTRAAPLSANADLSALVLSSGTLTPVFASGTTSYTASVSNGVASITVTPTVADGAATVKVNGAAVTSGSASGAIALAVGANTLTTVVTAQDASTKTYTVTVTRAAAGSVPGAPTIGAATPGNGSAGIAFTQPASDGGSPITGYTASCTGGGATVTGSGGASPVTVTGLSNGTLYSCSVTATNAVGTGAASGTVSVTPSATPIPTLSEWALLLLAGLLGLIGIRRGVFRA